VNRLHPSLVALIFVASAAIAADDAASQKPDKPASAAAAPKTKPQPKTKPATKRKAANSASEANAPLYANRADVMALAEGIATRRALDVGWVREAIGKARYMPAIARAVLPPPPGVPKNWTAYRSRFVEPVRIQAGAKFWRANRETLERAQAQTGVPVDIIVGIVGVESIYGQHTGNHRVLDALATLAFDFPEAHPRASTRKAFFLSELEEYLALTARTKTDPLALRGSYAGAMGWPQFMPSSWVKYAIDFDGDGRVDLFHSQADVIGSVANYFKAFNWKPGMPTHYALAFDAATLDKPALLVPDILPTFSVADMAAKGALVEAAGQQHTGPLALVELQNGDAAPQYVAGTENFYAITRYNWSSYYALAVIELGQAVAKVVAEQAAPGTPTPQ
jgi:membrane-bound lytic murein transglycosylase B